MSKTNVTSSDAVAQTLSSDASVLKQTTGTVSEDAYVPYHTRLNPPRKITFKSLKPSKVQESPLDARTPQEVLDYHGMYRDPSVYKNEPQKIYADLTSFDDLQTALNKQIAADEKFKQLPVDIRAKFNHSVVDFANYVTSPDFDVNEILLPDEQQKLKDYKNAEKSRKDFEAYQKTDEYKAQLEDARLRKKFADEQYQSWLANHKKT